MNLLGCIGWLPVTFSGVLKRNVDGFEEPILAHRNPLRNCMVRKTAEVLCSPLDSYRLTIGIGEANPTHVECLCTELTKGSTNNFDDCFVRVALLLCRFDPGAERGI